MSALVLVEIRVTDGDVYWLPTPAEAIGLVMADEDIFLWSGIIQARGHPHMISCSRVELQIHLLNPLSFCHLCWPSGEGGTTNSPPHALHMGIS